MTNKNFREYLIKWNKEALELNEKKSNDYASDDETLKNFKQMSSVLNAYGIKPPFTASKWALIMCLMKIQRLFNLIQSHKIQCNETLDDTLKDLMLYAALGRACLMDEEVK